MSPSNLPSLIPSRLTATYQGSLTNSNHIFPTSGQPVKACLCPVRAKQRYRVPTVRKLPLIRNNLITIFNAYQPNPSHNNLLFMSPVLTGFDCLMCLGELTWPDTVHLCDYRKVTM